MSMYETIASQSLLWLQWRLGPVELVENVFPLCMYVHTQLPSCTYKHMYMIANYCTLLQLLATPFKPSIHNKIQIAN